MPSPTCSPCKPKYTAWHEAVPETLARCSTADELQAIVELDLEALADIVPPRGYGRG